MVRGLALRLAIVGIPFTACRSDPDPPRSSDKSAISRPATEHSEPGAVLFRGCAEVDASATCYLVPTSTITVWVAADAPPSIDIDEQRILPKAERVQDGLRLRIPIRRAPCILKIRRGSDAARDWTLKIQPHRPNPTITAARRKLGSGDFDAADKAVAPILEQPDIAPRAQALSVLARVALRTGNFDAASARFQESIALHRAAGSITGELSDRLAYSFLLRNRSDYGGVRNVLAETERLSSVYPAGQVRADYYRTYAAVGTYDLRRALSLGTRLLTNIERLQDERLWIDAAGLQIETLALLGRTADALTLLAEYIRRIPAGPACHRANAIEVAGHRWMLLAQTPQEEDTARALLEQALALYKTDCRETRRYHYTMALLGHLALAKGDADTARRYLDRSVALAIRAGAALALQQRALAADLPLNLGRPARAEQAYRKLALLSRLYQEPVPEQRAAVGRGLALEALGRTTEAVDAYRKAESLLERLSFRAPLGAGRESFLSRRTKSAQHLIDLLVRLGRTAEAAEAARRSRARALLAVVGSARLEGAPEHVRQRWYEIVSTYRRQQQASEPAGKPGKTDWALSVEELQQRVRRGEENAEAGRRLLDEALTDLGASLTASVSFSPPKEDELILIYHRVPSSWVGFALTKRGATKKRLGAIEPDALSPEELGRRLLQPFDAQLRKVRRVRLLPHGKLNRVDIHALPFDGAPLIASRTVTYSLDLPLGTPQRPRKASAVVIDPHQDLPATPKEADSVQRTLLKEGWSVERISGSEVTAKRLKTAVALADTRLFHFAGHAHFAGFDGWHSHLGRRAMPLLGVADILTLPSGPQWVFLSGCETAAESGTQGASGLGLAQAFVLSGAQWVIASVRRIRDTDARAVADEVYAEQRRQKTWDAARLLASAQARLAKQRPDVDWSSFRVLSP